MKSYFFIFAFATIVFGISGCKTMEICNSTGGMEVEQTEGCSAQTTTDDPCFRDWLSVESAIAKRSLDGFLTAQVVLRNIHKDIDDNGREDDFDANCQVVWFDANGLVLQSSQSSWHRITWHGGQALPIKVVAPAPEAVRYVLRLRHVR